MSTTQETGPTFTGPREDKSASIVLLCGLATTALALLGIYVLDQTTDDFHIMGWYADYVIPCGALIVGVVASSGYGLGSWFSDIKITKNVLWTVVLLQVLAYFAAQYIEFKGLHLVHRADGSPVGFFEYYDATARLFAWKQDNGTTGAPLGAWGYGIRVLELLGFVGGSLIVPALLWKAPYCQSCQRYMQTRQLAAIPGSVPVRKIKKSDTAGLAAHQAEHDQAFESGKSTWETLRQLAVDGKGTDFKSKLLELEAGTKAAAKLPRRLALKLVRCKRCCCGVLHAHVLTGQGKYLKTIGLARVDVQSDFVRAVQS
jgi:hypothetical protein